MKIFVTCIALSAALFVTSCDVQSGITQKSVEKYMPTPTPVKTVEVVEQIDPADVVTVDTTLDGPKLTVNPSDMKANVDCTKYNRLLINGDGKEIKVKGVCKQLMINGDKNNVVAVGVAEIVVNGSGNNVEFSKYGNGKKPLIKDNGTGNTIEKAASVAH